MRPSPGRKGLILFFVAAVAVFIGTTTNAATRFTTVVIDAGHGGFDRGGIRENLVSEKTVNLDVAQRLKAILQKAGYNVVMTRDSDVFVPLGTRVAIANGQDNAIFVCIHFNSATRRGANGIETYFYSSESAPLAASIHSNVLAVAGTENRGVRRRGYFVLRRTTIPAILVECGFLTNPSEAEKASSPAYRQRLAQQIARGILNRPSIASRTRYTNTTSRVDVGLQPFYDQRHTRSAKKSSRHNSKKSTRKKKKSSSTKKKKKTTSTDE